MQNLAEIKVLIKRGAIFIVSHSAGKDSQAMYLKLKDLVPAENLIVIHADLGEVDWPGCVDHINETISGEEFYIVRNGNKTFLEMVERRGKFPGAQQRQCTSDLKRDPINKQIRAILKARGASLVVSCMGLRAQESSSRAKLETLKINKRNSVAGREWYDYLPIHEMLIDEVFATIEAAGQKPHPVYGLGMSRLSCSFCIMASNKDLCTAAKLRPELYAKLVEMEIRLGHTLAMSGKRLTEVTGIAV